ncbi:MAG: hypothetical protein JNM56_23585 [Planctomycetia bacterium]|nr:hypothetical protein [Planctomycetia bacterium]
MPDYDVSFKMVARASGQQLARLAGLDCHQWQPIGGEVQATERLADRAFRARRGRDRCVVYMEAYTRWNKHARWNVLAKSGLLSERERLPTQSLVYVLLPQGYPPARGGQPSRGKRPPRGTFRLQVNKRPTQQVWFEEICFWKEKPQPWWEEAPGLMALYPLCQHGTAPGTAVAHAAQSIVSHVADPLARADLLVTLAIFGRLKLPQGQVLDLIGRNQMIESPMYQEILAEGHARGQVNTKRDDIVEALTLRFGAAATAEFAEALRGLEDLARLADLFRVALGCRKLSEFRKALDAAAGK